MKNIPHKKMSMSQCLIGMWTYFYWKLSFKRLLIICVFLIVLRIIAFVDCAVCCSINYRCTYCPALVRRFACEQVDIQTDITTMGAEFIWWQIVAIFIECRYGSRSSFFSFSKWKKKHYNLDYSYHFQEWR